MCAMLQYNALVLSLLLYAVQSQFNMGPLITCFEQNLEVPSGFRDKIWQNETSDECKANPDLCDKYKYEGPFPGKGDVCDHTDSVTGLTRNGCYFNTIFADTINAEKTWSYKCWEVSTSPLVDNSTGTARPLLGCKVSSKRISCWCQTDFCNGGDFIANNLAKWGNPDNYPPNFDEICAYDWSGLGIYVDFSECAGYTNCSNYKVEPMPYAVFPDVDYDTDTEDTSEDTNQDTSEDISEDTNSDDDTDIIDDDDTEDDNTGGTGTPTTSYSSTSTMMPGATTSTSISSATSPTTVIAQYNDDDEAQLTLEKCVIKEVSSESCSCGGDCTAYIYSYEATSVSKCGSLTLITGGFGAGTCNPENTVYAYGDSVSCQVTDCENGAFRVLSTNAARRHATASLVYIATSFAYVYFSL